MACGVRAVYYKDEAHRFDLKSFKALGGAGAVAKLVNDEKSWAKPGKVDGDNGDDGNHSRSVSWGAKLAGCRAEIYIHKHVSSP